jgi:hypothetical protein
MGAAQDISAQSLPDIAYASRPDATPQAEISALAACYRIILESAKNRGRLLDKGGPDDAKERSKDDSSAKTRIP